MDGAYLLLIQARYFERVKRLDRQATDVISAFTAIERG
jgi:hypothetical protein